MNYFREDGKRKSILELVAEKWGYEIDSIPVHVKDEPHIRFEIYSVEDSINLLTNNTGDWSDILTTLKADYLNEDEHPIREFDSHVYNMPRLYTDLGTVLYMALNMMHVANVYTDAADDLVKWCIYSATRKKDSNLEDLYKLILS